MNNFKEFLTEETTSLKEAFSKEDKFSNILTKMTVAADNNLSLAGKSLRAARDAGADAKEVNELNAQHDAAVVIHSLIQDMSVNWRKTKKQINKNEYRSEQLTIGLNAVKF